MSEGIELPPFGEEFRKTVQERGLRPAQIWFQRFLVAERERQLREAMKRIAELESQQAAYREELRVTKRALEITLQGIMEEEAGDTVSSGMVSLAVEFAIITAKANPAAAEGGK